MEGRGGGVAVESGGGGCQLVLCLVLAELSVLGPVPHVNDAHTCISYQLSMSEQPADRCIPTGSTKLFTLRGELRLALKGTKRHQSSQMGQNIQKLKKHLKYTKPG